MVPEDPKQPRLRDLVRKVTENDQDSTWIPTKLDENSLDTADFVRFLAYGNRL